MKPVHMRLFGRVLCLAALASSSFRALPDSGGWTPETWRQRIEADWRLAEQVALLGEARSQPVSTRADAAGGCDGLKTGEWGFHTGESAAPPN